jgi:hypothetical protein
MIIEILEEDVQGDLQFSTFMGDDMWLEHDQNGDVEFALQQTENAGLPQPDLECITDPCLLKPDLTNVTGTCLFKPTIICIKD